MDKRNIKIRDKTKKFDLSRRDSGSMEWELLRGMGWGLDQIVLGYASFRRGTKSPPEKNRQFVNECWGKFTVSKKVLCVLGTTRLKRYLAYNWMETMSISSG
jgi:hypothetical protein